MLFYFEKDKNDETPIGRIPCRYCTEQDEHFHRLDQNKKSDYTTKLLVFEIRLCLAFLFVETIPGLEQRCFGSPAEVALARCQ